jgi:ATP/maltotriose-dependent transcriptional regulator MalT
VKLLPPQALLTRLQQGSGLLKGGGLDLPARQRTLRSTLQWSHDLLDEQEQRMLRRLSVFAGGCTLHAAEAVSGATGDLPAEVLELVASLVDKNLLRQVEWTGGEPRLFMLETIREYALERLAESGEEETVREAHANYYLALAEEAEPMLTMAEQGEWLEKLEAEHGNLRAALSWSLERGETGLRLAGALWRFWYLRGHLSEGRRWLEEMLAVSGGEMSLRAKVLGGAGHLAWSQGDHDRAEALRRESLALSRGLGDERNVAASLNGLAFVIRRRGEYAAARAMHEEALATYRKLGDKWGIARSIELSGRAAAFQGDHAVALPRLEEALGMWREIGDREGIAESVGVMGMVAFSRGDYAAACSRLEEGRRVMMDLADRHGAAKMVTVLGDVSLGRGDHEQARTLYHQALTTLKDLEDKWWAAWCLEGMAGLAAGQDQPERAAQLFGAAEALREAIGTPRPPAFLAHYERNLVAARVKLDETSFEMAWAKGRAMILDEAIEYALVDQPVAPSPAGAAGGLSPREIEVLRLVAEGLTDGQVAQRLYVSPRTVSNHLHSIYKKLGVPSRAAAARKAVEQDLL